jgi:hypothetical protein
MAHKEQHDFLISMQRKHPNYFTQSIVIDFGSLDINGNNRKYFGMPLYVGVDIAPGKNVDVVSKCHEFTIDKVPSRPDVVLSTEMLEHDMYWKLSLKNMLDILQPGGLLIITCATTGRAEHGTARTDKYSSPLTSAVQG